jgi:hypothetical protein
MFGRKSLVDKANNVIALITADQVDVTSAQDAAQELLDLGKRASVTERNEVIVRFSALIPEIRIGRAALLAVACGALVEQGAAFEPMAEPTLARFAGAVQRSIPFVEDCRALAASNRSPHDSDGDGDIDTEEAIQRFGQQVAERLPDAAQAMASLDWLTTATLAVLSRSKPLRRNLKANAALVGAIGRLQELGSELPCFHEMLALLDDVEIIVLHPAYQRGYLIRIAGIANNFQLHTLLADALIGDRAQEWLPGERPSAEEVRFAKDAPIRDPDKTPMARGYFNLWNWTGLQPDGALPDAETQGQSAGSAHWIWNEGIPADIVPFKEKRVILLGPPPYPRTWGSGRFFPSMVGELEVLRQLDANETQDWLDRLTRAPEPEPSGRYISAQDVEEIEF